jgi:diguanylate cyclase (GGDEF)-like protein/PAS domain S-box-containing protein
VGAHKNEPVLFSIMQKALSSVTTEQANAIYDKWFQLRTINQLDKRQLWHLSGYAILTLLFLVAWIFKYRYQKMSQQKYIDQINEYSLASLIELHTKKIVWTSQSYAKLIGYSPGKLIGQNFLDRASNAISADQIALIEALLRSGKSWTGEVEGVSAAGTPYWVVLTLTPQKDWRGKVSHVWATRFDITDKKRIERLSIVDELTGLFNRRYFNEQSAHELNRAKREQTAFAMATFDIDHFKLINDTYGHQQGDEALIALARLALARFNRASDFVFRTGGEEFMIITQAKSADALIDYLEDFRKAVLDLNIENSKAPLGKMSISIGACYWQARTLSNVEETYKIVDGCLYEAKIQGRNRLVICETETPQKQHN